MNLQDLSDRAEIIDLVAACAMAVDERNWPAYAACFTQDAKVDLGGRIGPVTTAELPETLRRMFADLDAIQHIVANSVVRLDGDAATHVGYVNAQHRRGTDLYLVACRYNDRLVRTDDGWRLCHRIVDRIWKQGDPGVIRPRD